MTNPLRRLFVAALSAFVSSPLAAAEIHKCIGDGAPPAYQDMPCTIPSHERPVDTRFANTLPLKFSAEDAEIIAEIADDRERKDRRRIEARDRRMRETVRRIRAKEARCRELTARYNELQVRQRRSGTRDPGGEAGLIRRMREACSA